MDAVGCWFGTMKFLNKQMKLEAYIDGSSLGNPGEAGCGVILATEEGTILEQRGWYLGHATNNEAEYQGLLHCLKMVQAYHPKSLVVYSDSELLVKQLHGQYKVRAKHLMDLHQQVKKLLEQGGWQFRIRHVPREKNRGADRLARNAIFKKGEQSG